MFVQSFFFTFQILSRNHSADLLSPSKSLSHQLIETQRNPLILKSPKDRTFLIHSYHSINQDNFTKNSISWWNHPRIQSVRNTICVLLIDFNGVSKDVQSPDIRRILSRVAGFRETPTFIIFQDLDFSLHHKHFFFFQSHSHNYAVTSPFIFVTNTFL